jgi:hypothetical protein
VITQPDYLLGLEDALIEAKINRSGLVFDSCWRFREFAIGIGVVVALDQALFCT